MIEDHVTSLDINKQLAPHRQGECIHWRNEEGELFFWNFDKEISQEWKLK